jgi:hypothetical protein
VTVATRDQLSEGSIFSRGIDSAGARVLNEPRSSNRYYKRGCTGISESRWTFLSAGHWQEKMNEAELEIMDAENRCNVRVCVSEMKNSLRIPLTRSVESRRCD